MTHDFHRRRLELVSRRHFLSRCTTGLGALWLSRQGFAWGGSPIAARNRDPQAPTEALAASFAPKAKRVIFLHMSGAPSQLELFDDKPELRRLDGRACPKEFLEGKRFAFIQGVPQMLGPQFKFARHGQSGATISERLPEFAKLADEVCFIKSMHTDQFNHAPGELLLHTGSPILGSPSIGSWVTWGLGTENENLPGYIALMSGGATPAAGTAAWGSGYLPSVYQGVQCRSAGEPVLYLDNPAEIDLPTRRRSIDVINAINRMAHEEAGDPETLTRIAQYETAYRMQIHATDAFDISQEPEHVHQLYGTQPGAESFANNCLLARRLAERGVRFIQLFDWGWDSHGANEREAIDGGFIDKCTGIDRPMAGLLIDLKRRGLLEDTLVVWGGEFGRTPMRENRGGATMGHLGRDHNPGAFTVWMAGGGVKAGLTHGETDSIGYEVARDPVSIHDLHATMLHLLGFDHHQLTYPHQGLDQRLTNVTKAGTRIVREILA